ncbi:hypothetical protein [Pelobacter seleniigenes]|uniref:hypothetical protein n=1 Tax=Pelobacter seleniigenes TaxID=407188 RepID=UPI0004A6DDF6|nr:hypothetical protein [Pelobacter seleniigenes]
MAPIKKLTAPLCQEIESRIAASLQPLAQEYGLTFEMLKGNLYPDGTTFGARCQFAVPERQATAASQKEEEDFLCYAESFGMRAEWLGKSFERGNFSYKVVGLRVGAPKECAILERTDGARSYENGALVAKYLA